MIRYIFALVIVFTGGRMVDGDPSTGTPINAADLYAYNDSWGSASVA